MAKSVLILEDTPEGETNVKVNVQFDVDEEGNTLAVDFNDTLTPAQVAALQCLEAIGGSAKSAEWVDED